MKKQFQRFRQQGMEMIGIGEKSDVLTEKLSQTEKKVEGIRNGCHVMTKRLNSTIQGSGSTTEKHQRKLPLQTLGLGMEEAGEQLGERSLFGVVLTMVGKAEQDIAEQMTQYEILLNHDLITPVNAKLEEAMKKVEKTKKKLQTARLDMDHARSRLRSLEHQGEKTTTREYPLSKVDALKAQVDEATRKFEDCQDKYATAMFEFLSEEQEYTENIQDLVKLQMSFYKQAATTLETLLPQLEKKKEEIKEQPVFGCPLDEHLKLYKRDIALVLEECITELRENWMDTEGLFRLAASSAKMRFLKSSFNAGQGDLSGHDPHTLAGCVKLYLRELPEPLLTYDLHSEWQSAAQMQDRDAKLQAMWKVKEKLPTENKKNLEYLLGFLFEFAQYSEVTKMNTSNIAIVIGPNLLWPRDDQADPATLMLSTAIQRSLAEVLIEHCRYFFPDIPEIPSPATPISPPPPNDITPQPTTPTTPSTPARNPDVENTPPMKPRPYAQRKAITAPPTQANGKPQESGTNRLSAGTPEDVIRTLAPVPLPRHGTNPSLEQAGSLGTTSDGASNRPAPMPLPRASSNPLMDPAFVQQQQQSAPSHAPKPITPPTVPKQSANTATEPKPTPRPPTAPKPPKSGSVSHGNPPSPPRALTENSQTPPSPKPRISSMGGVAPSPVTRTSSNDSFNSGAERLGSNNSLSDSDKRNSLERSPARSLPEPRPIPRSKRVPSNSSKPPSVPASRTPGRGPSRPAPPPPVKKPPVQEAEEEVTGL